mgnify:CR=1 FL=1
MNYYTLQYTNECQNDVEHEFEAANFKEAIKAAKYMSRGNEGLWFYITVSGDDGEYYEVTF